MGKSKSTLPRPGASGQSPTPKVSGKTVNLTLVQLRCDHASEEIDRVRRLLRLATGAVIAGESEFEEFKPPWDALRELLEMAESRLGVVSESLDCVPLKAEPTEEERQRVASMEKLRRECSEATNSLGASEQSQELRS